MAIAAWLVKLVKPFDLQLIGCLFESQPLQHQSATSQSKMYLMFFRLMLTGVDRLRCSKYCGERQTINHHCHFKCYASSFPFSILYHHLHFTFYIIIYILYFISSFTFYIWYHNFHFIFYIITYIYILSHHSHFTFLYHHFHFISSFTFYIIIYILYHPSYLHFSYHQLIFIFYIIIYI